MARTLLLVPILSALLAASCADRASDLSRELEEAQRLLSAEKYDAAYAEYERFANRGNPLAQFSVGLFYRLGWGRPVDDAKAFPWMEKAAQGGIPAAQHFYAEYLLDGAQQEPDPAKAAIWFKRAAESGYYLSYVSLAELHVAGSGVPKDAGKALEYCLMAAEHSVVPAQVRAGQLLLEAGDKAAAYGWFEKAAHRNDPEAQYHLGVLTRDSADTHESRHVARDWFERAAAQGHLAAYLPTGALYLDDGEGNPEPEELAKAYMWLTAATRRLEDSEERTRAIRLLDHVLKIMPEEWKPDLDKQVEQHLAEHAAS